MMGGQASSLQTAPDFERFQTLKSLKDDFGARSLIKKKDIITLKTGFGTIFDIDTKEELAKTKVND